MISLTLGAHAQRGLRYLLCVSVCLCVCLSVTALAATAFVSTCNERHYYLDFNLWIFEKNFCEKVMV